jgi:tetratricopeptide (TPR) repeat protein
MEVTLPLGSFYFARGMEMKHLKNFHLVFLPSLLLLTNGLPTLQQTASAAPKLCNSPSSESYELCMKLGYQTSMQRGNQKAALEYFRSALKLRPADASASKAIQNLELQMQGGKVMHVTPSGIGAPTGRATAGTRNDHCLEDGKKLVALIPEHQLGLTTMERPTLLFHIPPTSASTVKVTLQDESGATLYTKTSATPAKPDFVQFRFSDFKNSPPLISDKTYQWTFTLLCNPKNPSANVTVSGNIRRIELDPILTSELKTAKPGDRATLYAMNGLWYDTLATLVEALQADPNNLKFKEDWQELLKSSGLLELLEANR